MKSIEETMNTFLNLLRGKEEGGSFSRFKSWEYCHKEFLKAHELVCKQEKTPSDEQIDYLALHLSFYLASWGMYRGSSFVLQRDYKSHKKIVGEVLKSKYNDLWDYDPSAKNAKDPAEIAKLAGEAYYAIVEAYKVKGEIPERYFTNGEGDAEKPVSITLITKVLMGTFAISPAFDRFFQEGAKLYKNKHKEDKNEVSLGSFTNGKVFKKDIKTLFEFAIKHHKELDVSDRVTAFPYPIMKKVDMYFWEVGYEYGFYKSLEAKKGKLSDTECCFTEPKSKKAYKKTIEQIKTLFQDDELVEVPNDHLTTIENFMNYISDRL